MADGTVKKGGTFTYKVVAKNKDGDVLPISDATVLVSPDGLGSNSVNPDGTGGAFVSGAAGTVSLTPVAGGVTGTPFSLEITFDTTIASVTIVPDPPASVTVQPS